MSERFTLELPDDLARVVRAHAAAEKRPVEEAVVDLIGMAIADRTWESFSDKHILEECDSTLDSAKQEALSGLLARLREGELTLPERGQLDQLMAEYRRGLIFKARAWRIAVARGLKPRLDGHAA